MAIPKLLLAGRELASRDETGRGGGVNGMAELFDIGDEVVIYDVGGCGDDFAAGERRHIIAAMGHIVDCGKEIGFVRVDGFASDCEVNHFVGDGVESGANLITDPVAIARGIYIHGVDQIATLYFHHKDMICKGLHGDDLSLRYFTFTEPPAQRTAIH